MSPSLQLFQQRFGGAFVVAIARLHRERKRKLRVCAAYSVYFVPEREASSASSHAGFMVAFSCFVVEASLDVGFNSCSVYRHHFTLNCSTVHELFQQNIEDSPITFLFLNDF